LKLDVDDMELKAQAALGEHRWRVYRCSSAAPSEACGIKAEPLISDSEDTRQRGVVHDTSYDECHHHMSTVEAEHIAAADPAAVLALIRRNRELELALEDWRDAAIERGER
jgi:hypothetical protein